MFNGRAKEINKHELVENSEGYDVYKDRIDRALFFVASNFKPKSSYYHTVQDKLKILENLIDQNYKEDSDYTLALAHFLGTFMGIKLSPTIIATRIAISDSERVNEIKKIVNSVFTTPKFVANSLGYIKFTKNSKSFMNCPDWFKNILKNKCETFRPETWLKSKMRRREIKAKDIIKALKVVPKTNELKELFGKIIKSRAPLVVERDEKTNKIKATEATSVISNNNLTDIDKYEFLTENLESLPINQLIRNLSKFKANDAKRIEARLNSIFSSGSALRFLNPFDLVGLSDTEVQTPIIRALDRVLEQNILIDSNCNNPLVLFDISGSMNYSGYITGSKFLSLILPNFNSYNFYGFNTRDVNLTKDVNELIGGCGPNQIFSKLSSYLRRLCFGGTALLDSMQAVLEKEANTDLLIIVTDEETWAESQEITHFKRFLPKHLFGKTILINVEPTGKTAFTPDSEVVRMSGLDAKIFNYIPAIVNFDVFKKNIKKEFFNTLK